MNNKIVVSIYVPGLDETYDVFIPVGRKVKNIIVLCSKTISELSNGAFSPSDGKRLFNKLTGEEYNLEVVIKSTDIRNGTTLILL